jgi:hypothetical protein
VNCSYIVCEKQLYSSDIPGEKWLKYSVVFEKRKSGQWPAVSG